MKKISKYQGLVIQTKDYKEQASLVTILLDTGLNNYIVRGTKSFTSKTKPLTTFLSLISFNATDTNSLNTLTEGIVLNSYLSIIDDYDKLTIGYIIGEKIMAFTEQIDNKKQFYQFVMKTIDLLAISKYPFIVLQLFEIKLLYLLGIAPELRQCVFCQRIIDDGIEKSVLSVNNGGLCCEECRLIKHPEGLSGRLVKVFKYLYYIKMDKIDETFLELIYSIENQDQQINKIIDLYYDKYLDFNSKAKRVIKKL